MSKNIVMIDGKIITCIYDPREIKRSLLLFVKAKIADGEDIYAWKEEGDLTVLCIYSRQNPSASVIDDPGHEWYKELRALVGEEDWDHDKDCPCGNGTD